MPTTWGERVEAERRRALIPRAAEESLFTAFLGDPTRRLLALHGMPGSGKSTLLARLVALTDEPSQLLEARARPATPEAWTDALDPAARVIFLDDFDVLRPIFPYVTGTMLPSLEDGQKLVVAGRRPLPSSLRLDPGWATIMQTRQLGPLTAIESDQLLAQAGVPKPVRSDLQALAAGHPLALRAIAERWDGFDWAEQHGIRRGFIQRMLDDVSPVERRVLEVAALNRVATVELLGRIDQELADAFHTTAELPIAARQAGGLALAPVLREPLAQELAHTTPDLRDTILRVSLTHAEERTRIGPRERRVFWATNSVELIGHALKRGSSHMPSDEHQGPARAEHIEPLVAAIETELGEESARHARHWLERRPRGARVAWDSEGLIAYVHFLDLPGLAAEEIAQDPASLAFARDVDERGATRARLARFYLPFTDEGLPFVIQETTANLLFGAGLELACSAQPDRFLERYRELGAHPKLSSLTMDGEAWSISGEDLRRYTPADLHQIWSRICQADPSLLGAAPTDGEGADLTSAEKAYDALRRALRAFHDTGRLSRSALAKAPDVRARVASGEEPDPASAIRTLLRERVAELGETGEDGRSRRVLETSFFDEPRKQLAIAQELGVGESTYRRHLKLALERLAELWVSRQRT